MRFAKLSTLVLSLSLSLTACRPSPSPEPAPAPPPAPAATTAVVERTAEVPVFSATTVDGGHFDLAAHRGSWVVVNFWATWCAPCLKEMPELSALHAMREQVQVVGLAYEDISAEDMRAFLQERPVAYPIVIVDPMEPPRDFAVPRGLPTTYLIAPDGKVARQFLGPVTAHDLESAIAAAGDQAG